MNVEISIKKLGNHWYPAIMHDDPYDLKLDEKIEEYLSKLDKDATGQLKLQFFEQYSYIDGPILQFDEQDINRYMITDDDFDLNCYIGEHQFVISSRLYFLLEAQFNFNFHETIYRIELY